MSWLYVVGFYEGAELGVKSNQVTVVFVTQSESRACEVCTAMNTGSERDQPALVLRVPLLRVGQVLDVDLTLAAHGVPLAEEQTRPECWPDAAAVELARVIVGGHAQAAESECSTDSLGRKAVTGTLTATKPWPYETDNADLLELMTDWFASVCRPGTPERAAAEALARHTRLVRRASKCNAMITLH
jgi:hypothetical protein